MNVNSPITTIMTADVVCLNPSQKLVDAKHIFEKRKFHHHIPVVENGKLAGIISLVDYMHAIKDAGISDSEAVYQNTLVKDMMSAHPQTKSSSATIKEVAEELAKGEVHAMIIADNSELKGIVSTADVIRCLLNV